MSTTDRIQLASALESARTAIEGLLDEAGEARLTEPGVVGEWSVKDILAHVTAWEERIMAWAEALHQGTRPIPAPWPSGLSEEQVNTTIYQNNQARPLAEVLERWRQTHQKITETVQSMNDEELFQRKIDWLNGASFAEAIPGNSFEHIDSHANDMRAWLLAKENRELT